jgi:hypothetical protein
MRVLDELSAAVRTEPCAPRPFATPDEMAATVQVPSAERTQYAEAIAVILYGAER